MAAPFLVPALAPLTPRTALEALAGPPQRFLTSAWPWRSLAYLLTGIVPGSAFAAVLTPVRAMGGPAAVPMSLVVAAVLLTPVARFERWRLGLADRQPVR
ncbi:hypothetical protein GSF24_26515, partial [Microbispora triticiradicis]|nr:hypothetical protein [Microbispora triticiradicis]